MKFKSKICKECGKTFIPKSGGQIYCEGPHYAECVHCGKSFTYTCSPREKPKYCSKECRELGKKQYNIQKYGVSNVAQVNEVRSKISKVKKNILPKSKVHYSVPDKICPICSKSFHPSGSQNYCSKYHIKECEVCGKEFMVKSENYNKTRTCSRECASKLRLSSIPERTCKICGKKFIPNNYGQIYCNDIHYRSCPICGKPVPFENLSDPVKCCSVECSNKLREQTNLERYGETSPLKLSEAREACRSKSLLNTARRQQTCLERYGVKNVAQSDEVRRKISATISSDANQSRMKATMKSRYGVEYSAQSVEIAKKQAESRKGLRAIDGTSVDSSYELEVYNFCVRNNIPFKYNEVQLKFEYNGSMHVTTIDFEIDGILFECKGSHLLHRCYEDNLIVPIDKKLELYKKNHVILITDVLGCDIIGHKDSSESAGLKYPEKCEFPLIGVDISLFKNDIKFPYREDRPKCFYDVRVNGKQSCYEGFMNETLRWRMIKNRIDYVGGFIDSKEIVYALNVTLSAKQPSWFSKPYACKLLNTYSTSDTILDPFAGWGGREEASKYLNKKYYGFDLNPKLVQWHHENERYDILYGDASSVRYDKVCTVFTCPPYVENNQYVEDYNYSEFHDQSMKSESDWIYTMMINIPNATEYVVVCKNIITAWDKYVVEYKTNSNHFNQNKEKVVVISAEDRDSAIHEYLAYHSTETDE